MKISLLGPTNLKKFSAITGLRMEKIESAAREVGRIIAKGGNQLVVVYNYAGMIKLVGDSYKRHGGKLEMLYTENEHDWDTTQYLKHLKEADGKTRKESWHEMLLSLVTDADAVVCAGLSAGVLAELGYMKWNYQEKKGKVKALIGIKELLREGIFPPEISFDLSKMIVVCSIAELEKMIRKVR